jgi:transposase
MTFSEDLIWRAIVLYYVYSIDSRTVALLLGCTEKSVRNWMKLFEKNGHVSSCKNRTRSSRWPENVISFVENYVKEHPCFYIEELKHQLSANFHELLNTSESTICRTLRFNLQLSMKVLSKLAREKYAGSF